MTTLTEWDSPTRFIDLDRELDSELDAQKIQQYLEDGWRLTCITEQVVKTRDACIRHHFRHVTAPNRGMI